MKFVFSHLKWFGFTSAYSKDFEFFVWIQIFSIQEIVAIFKIENGNGILNWKLTNSNTISYLLWYVTYRMWIFPVNLSKMGQIMMKTKKGSKRIFEMGRIFGIWIWKIAEKGDGVAACWLTEDIYVFNYFNVIFMLRISFKYI